MTKTRKIYDYWPVNGLAWGKNVIGNTCPNQISDTTFQNFHFALDVFF